MIDLYAPRTMEQTLRTMNPAQTFIKDLFFRRRKPVITEAIDIDIVKGNRKMAPFVHPNKSGTVMERDGYTTNSYKPAMIKPKIPATQEDWANRRPGEELYSGVTPADRATELQMEDLAFLDEKITRREEWMCAQALFEGQVVQKGEGIDETVVFPLVKETLTGDAKWDSSVGGKHILQFIRDTRRDIVQKSGIAPNTIILGTNAFNAFIQSEDIDKFSSKDKTRFVEVEPQLPRDMLETSGVIYWGYLRDSGVFLYTYDEYYLDDEDGIEKPMIPEDHILFGNNKARTSLLYGAWTEADKKSNATLTYAGERIPRSWVDEDPPIRWVQMVSRPLPVPHQIDAFRSIKVV